MGSKLVKNLETEKRKIECKRPKAEAGNTLSAFQIAEQYRLSLSRAIDELNGLIRFVALCGIAGILEDTFADDTAGRIEEIRQLLQDLPGFEEVFKKAGG